MSLRTAAIAALTALAVAGPVSGVAQAAPNNGGGPAPKTCSNPNGSKSKPGEERTVTRTTRVKGRKFVVRDREICGEDGQWHQIA
jgi:hypothetical protein